MTTVVADDSGGRTSSKARLRQRRDLRRRERQRDVLNGNAGNDVILGDNGELDFDLDRTHDLDTLDLIRSYRDELGGDRRHLRQRRQTTC